MKYFIFLLLILTTACAAAAGAQEELQPQESRDLLQYPGDPPGDAASEFTTDFSRSLIPLDSILSGGPPKDGIPPIDRPIFESIDDAGVYLAEREPVLVVTVNDTARIYPLRVLMWHEIVNDSIEGSAVTVTYCPLCNTGIAFSRETAHGTLDFGTTGRLRFSNLIMYDRQTESWWQQATGEAVIGELAGEKLKMIPALMLSWEQAADYYPEAQVLSSETGYDRPYGKNPYRNYDSSKQPFLYSGPPPGEELSPLDRVLAIETLNGVISLAYSELAEEGLKMYEQEGIVVFFDPSTSSALDAETISHGRESGSALAFNTHLSGKDLIFTIKDDRNTDINTGSIWADTGKCIEGPLKGQSLQPVIAVNHFWFSFNAFYSE